MVIQEFIDYKKLSEILNLIPKNENFVSINVQTLIPQDNVLNYINNQIFMIAVTYEISEAKEFHNSFIKLFEGYESPKPKFNLGEKHASNSQKH